jgi:hypothetical protein
MKEYLTNLLPRLVQFSESLDKKEILIDQPWVLLDEHLHKHQYIFRREGQLIVALNGEAKKGRWEYISVARSLFIEIEGKQTLYKHGFVDKGILILQKDSLFDDPFMMMNERVIPDLDAKKYLRSILSNKLNYRWVQIEDGFEMEYIGGGNNDTLTVGTQVSISGSPVKDGIYRIAKSELCIDIRGSKIYRIFSLIRFLTDKGNIDITVGFNSTIIVGDAVYQQNAVAQDGKYRLQHGGDINFIEVHNGRIISITTKLNYGGILIGIVLLGIIIVGIVSLQKANLPRAEKMTPVDSSNTAAVDPNKSIAVSPPVKEFFLTIAPTPEIKSKILQFYNFINTDQIDNAIGLLNPTITRYFKMKQTTGAEVKDEIVRYRANIIYDSKSYVNADSISISIEGGEYVARFPQIDMSKLRRNGLPYIYETKCIMHLNKELLITSITGKLYSKEVHYGRLLGIAESMEINGQLFSNAFKKINDDQLNFEIRVAYKDALLYYFKATVPIYNEIKLGEYYYLPQFCDMLITGDVIFSHVTEVEKSNSDLVAIKANYLTISR